MDNFFYRDGTPERARTLLEAFIREHLPGIVSAAGSGDPEREAIADQQLTSGVVFFARAAEGRPEILRAYEDVARTVATEQVELVLKLLMHAGDAATAAFLREFAEQPVNHRFAPMLAHALQQGLGRAPEIEQAARAPVTNASHLDLRWAEFMATGDTTKVAEIVAVLGWPDRLRDHLRPLLAPRNWLASLFARRSRPSVIVQGLEPLGFRFDPTTHALLNREDLDLLAILSDGRPDGARFKAFVDALPVKPATEVAVAATTKASAMWSLASNAVEHPRVLAVCEAAAEQQTGAARLSLIELLTLVYQRLGDFAAARRAWSDYLALDPDRVGARERLVELELELQFADIQQASAAATISVELSPAASVAAARRCGGQLARTDAYHARAHYTLHSQPLDDEAMIRGDWRGRHSGRDRSRMWRAFWTRKDSDGLVDEWLDIDGVNYMSGPGLWIKTPPGFISRAADNALLRNDRFAALLRDHSPSRGVALSGAANRIELTYDAADLGDLTPVEPTRGLQQVTLSIDPATHWLTRVRVAPAAGSARDFELICSFVVPERPFTLEAPPGALDMTNATPTSLPD
ncbi:MAG: hypothetical protein H0T76_02420 [Nannocystis sp.]|nr:hypothetical protein [Nannocystis sp.]MBA3545316.1 hypothetical protein [Nannocystis sp.]